MTERLEMMISTVYDYVDNGMNSQEAVDRVIEEYKATEDEITDINAYGFCF